MQPNYYNFYNQPTITGMKLEKATLEEVKKANIMPNQTIYYLDPNEPYLYVKNADANGQLNIRGFCLTEVDLNKMIEDKKFITKQDFDNFKAELLSALRSKDESNIQQQ